MAGEAGAFVVPRWTWVVNTLAAFMYVVFMAALDVMMCSLGVADPETYIPAYVTLMVSGALLTTFLLALLVVRTGCHPLMSPFLEFFIPTMLLLGFGLEDFLFYVIRGEPVPERLAGFLIRNPILRTFAIAAGADHVTREVLLVSCATGVSFVCLYEIALLTFFPQVCRR